MASDYCNWIDRMASSPASRNSVYARRAHRITWGGREREINDPHLAETTNVG
jgi:hypothetical protein